MQAGTQPGHDTILSDIGKGGMGEVWKAKDTKRSKSRRTLPTPKATTHRRIFKEEGVP